MKNIRLPNNNEWNSIIDDAFSSDEIHTFSENYNMKKQSMRKGIAMKKNNLMLNLTVAAAALAVVAFPTGIYFSTHTAGTQPSTEIPAENDEITVNEETTEEFAQQIADTEITVNDGVDDGEINKDTHVFTEEDEAINTDFNIDYDTIYDVEYGWLPEGLEYQEQDSPYGGKFHNWDTDDGMTPILTKVPKGATYCEDIGNPEIEAEKTVWSNDGKTVSMYYRSTYGSDNISPNFGRIAFIYFDNTPYVLQLYVTDGISEEDFYKIIKNVKLVPSEKETTSLFTQEEETTDSYNDSETTTVQASESAVSETSTDILPTVKVGETINEKYYDVWGKVSATVTNVSFNDNLDGITTDNIGNNADYSQYLNTDGSLIENVRKWFKSEDNTEFKTETVPISIMTVNITYTNNGTEPVDDYCICPTLQTKDDGYFLCLSDYNKVMSKDDVYYIDTFKELMHDDMCFSFSCPKQSGKNNICLEPGESTEVTLAFVVEDKFRDNLYLSMDKNGFVDLSAHE